MFHLHLLYAYHVCAQRPQRLGEALDHLELELLELVSYHVGAVNQTEVLCKSTACWVIPLPLCFCLTLNPTSQPSRDLLWQFKILFRCLLYDLSTAVILVMHFPRVSMGVQNEFGLVVPALSTEGGEATSTHCHSIIYHL